LQPKDVSKTLPELAWIKSRLLFLLLLVLVLVLVLVLLLLFADLDYAGFLVCFNQ
jgi:hypothetical protein